MRRGDQRSARRCLEWAHFSESLQSCAQVHCCASRNEHSEAKAAVDKEWEQLEKMPAWQLTKVRNKNEVIQEAHLKEAELEPQFQQYKCRVVLRGEIVKDDSGSCAVCTEQGSSASQMTAAQVMDAKARLPGCAGQAAGCSICLHSSQNGR